MYSSGPLGYDLVFFGDCLPAYRRNAVPISQVKGQAVQYLDYVTLKMQILQGCITVFINFEQRHHDVLINVI